jgi:prephenate dehydratase
VSAAALRAAYLGPPGTFSEEALLASTELAGGPVEAVALATVPDVVLAVQEGHAERGVVPIESAVEGSVDATLDALAARAPDVAIVGEVVRPVRHALVAAPPVAAPGDVAVVVSHPQALAQCAAFLRRELPGARAVAWTSTAEAVRAAAEHADEGWAAIGTPRAAGLYGCAVLREGVEDVAANATRFVWLAREGAVPAVAPGTAGAKTSLVFAGTGGGEPGWLVRCLSEFAFRGVNLTRIESRPRRDRLGDYLFFVDLEGAAGDERVAGATEGLRARCDLVRVLGSYRTAEPAR